jgi:hypothetical protein
MLGLLPTYFNKLDQICPLLPYWSTLLLFCHTLSAAVLQDLRARQPVKHNLLQLGDDCMRSKSVVLIAVLLTPVSFVSMAFPQTQKSGSDAVAEVTRLQQESVKADLANDPSFVKQYYAGDYTSGSSWGISDTKASVLKDMSDPQANKTNKEEISDLKVRAYGNTVIANFKETYDSLYHGEHRARSVMCTDTWVKQGTWKLVADHCSQLAK